MDGQVVMDCLDAVHEAIETHRDEIAGLDQAIGDGDHVFNLLRGLASLNALRDEIVADDAAGALNRAARKLLSTIGGSSGPLLSSLLAGMAEALGERTLPLSATDWAHALAGGITQMQRRGKTGTGSKTMMDVLIPVSERFVAMASQGRARDAILDELPRVAEQGMLATRDMIAMKGRASFLGERAIGHIDPGARSCQIMIEAACRQLAKAPKGARHHEEVSQ